MKTNIFITTFILSILTIQLKAEWVKINKSSDLKMAPQTTILRSDGDGIVLRVDMMGFDIKNFEAEGNTYQSIDLLTDMFTTIPGSPELPYIAHVLAIPDKAGVTVEVIEKGYKLKDRVIIFEKVIVSK